MQLHVLLLACAVVIATNVRCQAKPQLGHSDRSPGDKGQAMMSRQQGRLCNCSGRKNTLDQGCPCELQRQHRFLTSEQKAICVNKRIATFKKCHLLIHGGKGIKGISIPI